MEFFADLHVHIGSAKGRPVKITASRRLNIINIIKTCIEEKGINIVGIIDCASRPVIEEIQEYIDKSHLIELENGGLSYQGKLTIILGAEVETTEQEGAAHSLAFFPYINQIKI
ncbi:MAG TPA: TIGR00375 family protein, partial [Thermoanaerobacterales bacterium]|nr:TIGR00375 family protein [Thermoanaerobacterales bacterium]